MQNSNNIVLTVHQITEDGTVNSYKYEEDFITHEVVSKTPISGGSSINFNSQYTWSLPTDNKVELSYRYRYLEPDDQSLTIVKIGEADDLNPLNYAAEIGTVLNDPADAKTFIGQNNVLFRTKRDNKIPNIPTMVRCQNCDTNFPTKYQYQRHQCEFNAEKVVLKADADIKDIDKGMRIKYDCVTCGKQFVSKNNLERHQTSHDSTQENVCEHCNKQFVSENRLRIHKENHCKKAGDISKFYRSDVTVWKCITCNQVFATPASATRHADLCTEELIGEDQTLRIGKKHNSSSQQDSNNALNNLQQEIKNLSNIVPGIILSEESCQMEEENSKSENTAQNVEKVLTELLLQCEYCNRTYSERNVLMDHQKKHTTEFNYECATCKETFDSYTSATKHWMTKCSDEANLFYLPKMTYCEYCDRTFKSHEILYTHKIKKKHYAPKLHLTKEDEVRKTPIAPKSSDGKEILVKFIENALTMIDVSKRKVKVKEEERNGENLMQDEQERDEDAVIIKDENGGRNNENQEPEKKKRGRKRKWPKQVTKTKRLSLIVDQGYKFQCERCVLVFENVSDLEVHREKEHASNFSCEECGQIVHSAKALIIHSRAHQSLKPYVCEQCGRSYSQTSHLWQHMRFHQGIKPFACPHEGCEARYTIRPDLKDHIRKVHTRERPFKCAVCNKCFLTGSVYYQHRLIHTNDRRYGCDICEKRFFRADALNNHRRIHTDERPYPCNICGREFRQKGDRNKHVRTQHPE